MIHPPPPNATIATHPVPIYTLTRLSATSTNTTWFQHNGPSPGPSPAWATTINKLVSATVPESLSHYPLDSASGSSGSETEPEEENGGAEANERRVAPRRVRIWALEQSPGGGSSVVLFSKHSAIMPDRICRSRVAFAPVRAGKGAGVAREGLSAEGAAWEWMYGGGAEVRGFSGDVEPVLGDVFEGVRREMMCVLCKGALEMEAGEFVCSSGHIFGKFILPLPLFYTAFTDGTLMRLARCATSSLPVLSPSTSRKCALCGRPNLLVSELLRLAEKHGLDEESLGRVKGLRKDVSSACGGKFVV